MFSSFDWFFLFGMEGRDFGYLHRRMERNSRFVGGRVLPLTDGMRKPPVAPNTMVRHPAIVIASRKLSLSSALIRFRGRVDLSLLPIAIQSTLSTNMRNNQADQKRHDATNVSHNKTQYADSRSSDEGPRLRGITLSRLNGALDPSSTA